MEGLCPMLLNVCTLSTVMLATLSSAVSKFMATPLRDTTLTGWAVQGCYTWTTQLQQAVHAIADHFSTSHYTL